MARVVFGLCLFFTLNCYAQEQVEEKGNETIQGEGWVIELDSSTVIYEGTEESKNPQAVDENTRSITSRSGKGVEFIIGGQGKDGVAKKGKLPVDD